MCKIKNAKIEMKNAFNGLDIAEGRISELKHIYAELPEMKKKHKEQNKNGTEYSETVGQV